MRDIIQEIYSTTKHNKLRTALTGFSVAWGIFMLIFLLGAGNGLINATMSNSGRFLKNSMMVGSGITSKAYDGLKEGRTISLNERDVDITNRNFTQNVDMVGATVSHEGVTISIGENYTTGSLEGVYPNKVQINKIEMLYGRFVNQIDLNENRKILVISEDMAKELSPNNVKGIIGRYVKVNNFAYHVVGVYKDDQSRSDNNAYTAFSTVVAIYSKGDKISSIEYSFHGLNTQKENDQFESRYRARVNAHHRAAPDDTGALWLWNRFTQSLQMNQGMSIIRTALWVIGLFTLLSGIVGVSNIMLITVKERTREFGIRKAIGASPASILRLIIIESIIITTIFGYVGMVLGIGANQYLDATMGHTEVDTGLFQATMFLNPTVGLDVCIEATLTLIIAGTLAGLIPARKAARIRPIEALKAE
jgi:putative ABC transport system permease protein